MVEEVRSGLYIPLDLMTVRVAMIDIVATHIVLVGRVVEW